MLAIKSLFGNISRCTSFQKVSSIIMQHSIRQRSGDAKVYVDKDGNQDIANNEFIQRFKRLRWGGYIHAVPGRHKHKYRKPEWLLEKSRQHVFNGRAMAFLCDRNLNREWRSPKYYPNDPYEPYHTRTGVPWDYANKRRKFFP